MQMIKPVKSYMVTDVRPLEDQWTHPVPPTSNTPPVTGSTAKSQPVIATPVIPNVLTAQPKITMNYSNTPRATVEREEIRAALTQISSLAQSSLAIGQTASAAPRTKAAIARTIAAIHAAEIAPRYHEIRNLPLKAILAADATDANVGILSGALVAQRALETFRLNALVRRVTSDFSDEPAVLNQSLDTRSLVTAALLIYNSAISAQGTPVGWTTAIPSQTVDSTTVLSEHCAARISLDSNILASTMRRLFEEMAPAAYYALANRIEQKLQGLMTVGNFNGYAVAAPPKIPVAYASFPAPIADFGGGTLAAVDSVLTSNRTPTWSRTAVLIPAYHAKIAADPRFVAVYGPQESPEIPTENTVPKLGTFYPLIAPDLTTNNATQNLVGFAMQKAALVIAARPPSNYNTLLPQADAKLGRIMQVTDPDSGLSALLVQYVGHSSGIAGWRLELLVGAGVGTVSGGLCLVSQ